jgi:hypothetical protein
MGVEKSSHPDQGPTPVKRSRRLLPVFTARRPSALRLKVDT